ncbi:MAG TPA: HIT domain-containing protein, partial [Bacilli bacterium]|nr:HIT domain-containing protein [Bacilli bacterium]
MKDCIFCKIIDNEISSYTIYEDEIVKVFLDIDQSSQGHMLVIPKEHTLDMTTISDETLMHI